MTYNENNDPIDKILDKIYNISSPMFNLTFHTPNIINFYSFLTGLASCYFLFHKKILLFSVFYIFSYFFENFSLFFSKKYNFSYNYKYNIIKNIFLLLIIFFITKHQSKNCINISTITSFAIIFILIFYQLLCKDICFIQSLCNYLDWCKYFNTASFTLIYILIINFCYM